MLLLEEADVGVGGTVYKVIVRVCLQRAHVVEGHQMQARALGRLEE